MASDLDIPAPTSTAAPWWLQPLYAFGIPAGIAVFLVWFLTSVVVSGQKAAQDTLEQHIQDMKVDQTRQLLFQARELQLLMLLCRNSARTERARNDCDAVTR